MEEKHMVNDTLENLKNEIKNYTNAIIQTESPDLRQTLQSIRSSAEGFEYELTKLASSKGYYSQIPKVKPEELNKLKNYFINNLEN